MASTGEQQQQPQPVPTSPTETPTQMHNQNQNQNQNTHLSSLVSSRNATQTLPPQTPSFLSPPATANTTTVTSSSFNGRKRPLDHFGLLQSSPYFKMRIVAKDLRSLFLEVLRAPDFQNCDAAQGIQGKLKLMLDLCKQKTVENVTMAKCSGGERIQETTRPFSKAVEERRLPIGNNLEKSESNKISGTYIVGGSSLGWNFIMFNGTKPEYYGRTKEAFRAGK